MVFKIFYRIVLSCLVVVLLGSCTGKQAFDSGEKLLRQARYDEAVYQYNEAVQKSPDSDEYQMRLFAARNRAALDHLDKARLMVEKQEFSAAIIEYQQAIALDPSLEIANQELASAEESASVEQLVDEAQQFIKQRRYPQAKLDLDKALVLIPDHAVARKLMNQVRQASQTIVDGYELETNSTEPITLKFKDARVQDVFKILSDLSGITFIFDDKVNATRVNIQLEKSTFSQALELLLKMNDMAMRVLNPKTVILYPKTKDKEKQYEDQIIQTFYLSNIDAKKAVNLLRTMLQLRKVYVHEELNALVIRDNPEVVKLAQQILEAADRSGGEVLFALELIEVQHTDDFALGAKLDAEQIKFGLGNEESGFLTGPVSNLKNLNLLYTVPTASFDFQKNLTDSEILANPVVRVKNGAKAKVHVGSREPIVTTTNNATGDVTSTNIQYVDVGVKLDLEADIQLDNTIVTKIGLEVSNKGAEVPAGDNVAFAISTTNAQTELVLKDGERTILGGLIKNDESTSSIRLPIIGSIPLIGDLLASHSVNKNKREILLSITPHIVKKLDLPKADVASIWSGGEDDLKAGPTLSSFAVMLDAEQAKQPPAVVPAQSPNPARPMTTPEPVSELPAISEPDAVPASIPAGTELPEPIPAPDAGAAEEPPALSLPTPEPPAAPAVEEVVTPDQINSAPHVSRAFVLGSTLVDVGQEFILSVMISDVEKLFSAPLFIKYDSTLLDLQRVDEGSFLRKASAATVFTTSPNPAQGRIIIGYKQAAGGEGVSGSGELYQLVFTAKQAGNAAVNLEQVNFTDPTGKRLPVIVDGIQVEIR